MNLEKKYQFEILIPLSLKGASSFPLFKSGSTHTPQKNKIISTYKNKLKKDDKNKRKRKKNEKHQIESERDNNCVNLLLKLIQYNPNTYKPHIYYFDRERKE